MTLSDFSFPDGSFSLQLFSDGWTFGEDERTTIYGLQVDRIEPWEVSGSRSRSSVVSVFDIDEPQVRRLFREIRNGSSLVIRSDGGDLIDRSSLSGSAANLAARMERRDRIAAPGAQGDPFAAEVADPF